MDLMRIVNVLRLVMRFLMRLVRVLARKVSRKLEYLMGGLGLSMTGLQRWRKGAM